MNHACKKLRSPLLALNLRLLLGFVLLYAAQATVISCTALAQATQPTTQPAPTVANGIDLAAALITAKPSSAIVCAKNGHYTLNSTVTINAVGVTIDGNGSSLACKPTAGASSDIVVRASNFTLKNFNVTCGGILVYTQAPNTTVSGCTATGCNGFFKTDQNGTNACLINCVVNLTQSVGAYITADNSTIDTCLFTGSAGEYCVRYDSSDSGRIPTGAKIIHTHLINHNTWHKQALGLRFIYNATVDSCSLDGSMRLFQSPGAPNSNGACVIRNCTFTNPDTSNAITIYSGGTVEVSGNTFLPTVTTPPVSVDVNSVATVSGNIQQWKASATTQPPRIIAISSAGKYSMSGNTIQKVP